ncbi:MAG: TIGR02300 family protein [Acidobacteria bacterium]|nr:MAG: TIGR02300 family protein [Acidobacteriota bacterium]
MADLGRKYTCYSCHTKFYDLNKPVPTCPKCGADQRDAEEAPAYTPSRGRARVVVEEPPEEEEFTPAAEPAEAAGDEEEEVVPARDEEPAEDDEDEEEEY